MRTVAATCLIALILAAPAGGAPKPVPQSPYLPLVYRYADTMLRDGRDTYGPQKTGLLLSALNRTKVSALDDRPEPPTGVPQSIRAGPADGPLVGADPQHDQNLLRVLYTLTELSGRPIYRDAADAELKWFLEKWPARESGPPPWDEGAAWDVVTDRPNPGDAGTGRSTPRPWMLWDRCFDLSPEASGRLVRGLHVAPPGGASSPRRIGFSVRAFAVTYQRTKDASFLKSIEDGLARLEAGPEASSAEWLSAAIDCGGAAGQVPEPLATRLRGFAARQDREFCALPHDLKGARGFATQSRRPAERPDHPFTPLWQARHDLRTTATVAMMCVSRYENTGDVRYRELIRAAADAYRDAPPPHVDDVWPMVFGHAISLQLAAWRSTAQQEYLDRARTLADVAVETFWADSPLPRASSRTLHYETVAGADTLALALVELHLSILHITAVRCPPNTIDR